MSRDRKGTMKALEKANLEEVKEAYYKTMEGLTSLLEAVRGTPFEKSVLALYNEAEDELGAIGVVL